ncbi:MAG: hypothetical protein ACXWPS_05105, partial [Ktedonobacteraceae bacterium]
IQSLSKQHSLQVGLIINSGQCESLDRVGHPYINRTSVVAFSVDVGFTRYFLLANAAFLMEKVSFSWDDGR